SLDAEIRQARLVAPVQQGLTRCAAWNADRSRLVTGGSDGFLHFWDAKSGKEIGSWKVHNGAIPRLSWSPDGKLLATVAGSTVHVWDTAPGKKDAFEKPIREYPFGSDIRALAWSPDGENLAYGGEGWEVRVWSAAGKYFGLSTDNVYA